MNPYDEACATLLRHLHVWVNRYSRRLCSETVTPDHSAHDSFRRRHWRCWRFHWQAATSKKSKGDARPPESHRQANGITVAITMVTGQFGSNLVRDVTLAEALTQEDSRAAEILQREYAEPMRRAAERTCDRLADEAWSNVFGECFGAKGRLATYGGQRPLSVYLKTIVIREIYALAKREARRHKVETAERSNRPADPDQRQDSTTEDPAENLIRQECELLFTDILQAAFARLSSEERLLIEYRYVHDLTYEEIGRILGVHKGTAQRRLDKATAHLMEAAARIIDERKQTQAVADCAERMFRDRGCCDLAELLGALLRAAEEAADEQQGRGDRS